MPVKNATDLLAPLSVDEFVRDYWGQKPIHIPSDENKLRDIFDRADFFEYAKSPHADMFVGKADVNRHFHQLSTTTYNARALYRLGLTVQMEDIHWFNTPVRELLDGLKHEIGLFAGMEAAAFLSPPGTGYGIHYDPNPDIWALQISGEKTWRYSPKPAARHPIEHVTLNPTGKPRTNWVDIDRPDESEFLEAHLTPGDVFYFPAGTWHTAEASEESCHLVLASQVAPWTDFVLGVLRQKLLHQADWRQIPLHHHAWDRSMHDILKDRMEELTDAVQTLDLNPRGEIMQSFLKQAQLDEGRDEETGMSPWAYRAKRVSFAEAKNLIDHDTEEMIQHRKNPDT